VLAGLLAAFLTGVATLVAALEPVLISALVAPASTTDSPAS